MPCSCFARIQAQGYAGSYKSVSRWFQGQGLLPRRERFGLLPDELVDIQPQPTPQAVPLPGEEHDPSAARSRWS